MLVETSICGCLTRRDELTGSWMLMIVTHYILSRHCRLLHDREIEKLCKIREPS